MGVPCRLDRHPALSSLTTANCSQGKNAATTVSATMILAAAAGIRVFVTGGIGGVHRGGEDSMDVSADLTELGRTPIAVICAGAKSVLDIPRTLEYLETQVNVPILPIASAEVCCHHYHEVAFSLSLPVYVCIHVYMDTCI